MTFAQHFVEGKIHIELIQLTMRTKQEAFRQFQKHMETEFDIATCAAAPNLFRTSEGYLILCHVDDMLLLCIRDTYVKGMEKKYDVSFECIAEVGESLEHDGLLIQVTNKYVETLSQKLKTRSGRHRVPTSVADLKQSSHEQELPHTQHSECAALSVFCCTCASAAPTSSLQQSDLHHRWGVRLSQHGGLQRRLVDIWLQQPTTL